MRLTEITHHSHPEHLLKLEQLPFPYKCEACYQIGFGTCYECKNCNFHIHKECALPVSPFHHPLIRKCDFEFKEEPPHDRICDACLRDIKGYSYQCPCHERHDLHPCCAKLPETLVGEKVVLKLSNKIPSKCLKCQSQSNSMDGAKGWAYVSACKKYCVHVACVKEMVYDFWEQGYFNGALPSRADDEEEENGTAVDHPSGCRDVVVVSSGSGMEIVVPSSSSREVVVSSGGRRTAARFRTVISILTLIISAVFGDPITAFAAVIIALARSLS